MRKQKIISELDTFMNSNYPHYNPVDWMQTIERYANKAGKYPLCECSGIWITEHELMTIAGIRDKVLERLAFTLLCLAKFRNFRNSNNNNWVSNEDGEIYKLARITTSAFDKGIRFNKLRELGLIEFAKKVDNLNIQVLFVDDDSDDVLFVSDFRELGNEYRLYKGERYIRCSDCGILVKNTNGKRKYCKECAAKVNKQQRRERYYLSKKQNC